MKHGTVGAYNRYGCRCDDCRLAKSKLNKRVRLERKANLKAAREERLNAIPNYMQS